MVFQVIIGKDTNSVFDICIISVNLANKMPFCQHFPFGIDIDYSIFRMTRCHPIRNRLKGPGYKKQLPMALNFTKFIENITLTEAQWKDAKTKYEGVCSCLDKHFYDSAYNESHKFLFGSYKLRTCVRPIVPEQDVDVLFRIDYSTYEKYQDNPGGLLQEVRKALKEKYTTTDIIKAWGKVVLIQFSDGTHNVEVLPAYEMESGEFLIPNTENGGSWNIFDPRTSIKSFQDSNQSSNSLTQELTKMIKTWKRNTATLEYKSYRIAEDVTNFVNNIYPDGADAGSYLSVIKNFFTYIFNRISVLDARYSHINTAKTRVEKAYQYEEDGKHIEASEELRKVFGDVFPKEEKNDSNSRENNSFTTAPSPWRAN